MKRAFGRLLLVLSTQINFPGTTADAVYSLRHNFIVTKLRWIGMLLVHATYQPACDSGNGRQSSQMLEVIQEALGNEEGLPLPEHEEWKRSAFDLHCVVDQAADLVCKHASRRTKEQKKPWYQVDIIGDGRELECPDGFYDWFQDWERSSLTCPQQKAITADLKKQSEKLTLHNLPQSPGGDSDSESEESE